MGGWWEGGEGRNDSCACLSLLGGVRGTFFEERGLTPALPKPRPQVQLLGGVRGTFLEERGLLRAALRREREWARLVPG